MITRHENGMARVTVTLDPEDIELLDRLAKLEGSNRSAELRGLLTQVRPMIRDLVEMFERAASQREALDAALVNLTVSELQAIMPEVDEISRRFLGTIAKLEGTQAAADAPASNTGATD
jgi:Ribbon-helix-helix protein, copG family